MDISGRTFITSNFLTNLVFSTSLNLLWSMANSLQIIVHLPLINITLPYNVLLASSFLANVASFEIIPTEAIYSKFLSFDRDKTLKDKEGIRYELVGMETSNFLINSGTLFWMFMIWVMGSFWYLVLKISFKLLKKEI